RSSYHLVLHSFPTRRSSDLEGAKRSRSFCTFQFAFCILHWPSHAALLLLFVIGVSSVCAQANPTRELGGWVGGVAFQPEGKLLRSEEHTSELQSLRHLVCRL